MIYRLEMFVRRLRKRLSRSEWLVRWLKLPHSEGSPTRPGLVMIQIDGLSRYQLQRAINKGRMPFLEHLMRHEGYGLHGMFSGVPSNTPSVQGELFYGVRQAAPAFSYYDRARATLVRMYDPGAAASIEKRLADQGQPLLAEGTAYCDVYTGGADQAQFCFARLGYNDFFVGARPLAIPLMILANLFAVLRMIANVGIELVLAIFDFFRGVFQGQSFGHELRFIPFRVGITSLMRDLITLGAKIDIARGVPIIHLNFLGYDEQAHRRGPGSAFAHWTLKGIDTAIRHIWHAAHNASRRDYDVWVYSDHGQEATIPFPYETGRTIEDAVAEVFDNFDLYDREDRQRNQRGIQNRRIALFGGRLSRVGGNGQHAEHRPLSAGVRVTAMGPLGHIYLPEPLGDEDERERLAAALVREAKIPLVLVEGAAGRAVAWNKAGRWQLPDNAAEVLGADHPCLEEAAKDMVSLCHLPNSGDFVISGWRTHKKPMSFPIENGAHAGPGIHETDAFALLPADAPFTAHPAKPFLRPADLRQMVLDRLGRIHTRPRHKPPRTRLPDTLRVMTYNIHSCIGMDGKIAPERVARILGQFQPDVVALQEVDVGRRRTGFIDQAELIAHLLEMNFAFHPALTIEEEQYGIAVLSRFPMKLLKAGPLPRLKNRHLEPRGALWIAFEHEGHRAQLINTHLGLRHRERIKQVEALLGPDWLGNIDPEYGPMILCGDLNAIPRSVVCRRLSRRLLDAQDAMENHRPRATWFGRYPIGRIDHIFIEPKLSVCKVKVVNTRTARLNSDHLPLIVDLRLATVMGGIKVVM
ncbi:endonuclease/exonuclease/phosphatase family protein [bacterium]|nr:endonuclease/exonuclease/phosphatase family protein [bacterium]